MAATAAILLCVAPMPANALSCMARTGSVSFGSYDPKALLDDTSSGYVEVKCACTLLDCIAFTYTIEIGSGASGSVTDRRLRKSDQTSGGIQYGLYRDATLLLPWDVGNNKTTVLYLLSLFGTWQRTTIFGKIPSGQAVASGSYSDAPAVIITY